MNREALIAQALAAGIQLSTSDLAWAGEWTIDGMPAQEWLDAMLEDEDSEPIYFMP